MKKILITGGTGFIGSHTAVAVHLNGDLPVLVDNFSNSQPSVLAGLANICQRDFPFYEGDCNDPAFLRHLFEAEQPIDGVIHFAAFKSVNESITYPGKYYRNNIGSLLALLDVMKKNDSPGLVFSSSCTVYGIPDQCPVTEDAPMKETPSPYGKTKQICEMILQDTLLTDHNLKAIALRYFNPIGAHPSGLIGELPLGVPNNLVPYIAQTAAGLRKELTIFGSDYPTSDGTCVRDFIHVMDVATAHVKALEAIFTDPRPKFCDVINIGTGKGHSVLEVIETFQRVTGQTVNCRRGQRREGDVPVVFAQADRARNRLKWEAKLSLEEALKDVWTWQQYLMRQAKKQK